MDSIRLKVQQLGLELPPAAAPVANFQATARAGDLLYVSGQIGISGGVATHVGTLGDTYDVDDGYTAAKAAALSVVSHLAACTGDSLSRVQKVLKLIVFVSATPKFSQHPQVANGASDLLVQVFGDAGHHARSAVGVASLPLGAAVEVEAIVQLSPHP